MAFFGGMRGGGGGGSNKGKASASFMQSLSNKRPGSKEPTADEKYKKMFEDRLAAAKKEAGASKHYSFALPGTKSEPRKMSKSAEALLAQLAAKKTQQEMKKARKMEAKRVAADKRQVKLEMLKKQKEAAAKGPNSIYGTQGHGGLPGQPADTTPTSSFWGGGSDKKDDGGWW